MKRIITVLLALAMLLPVTAIGEAAALPFGLTMGMSPEQAEAAFKASDALAKLTPDKVDNDDGSIEYIFDDVAIPGADGITGSLTVDVDQNNSLREYRLTSISLEIGSPENCISLYRTLLASMTAQLGAPNADPFGEDGVNGYVEWGTLDAAWATDSARASLSLNRMFGDSVSILYTSRLNYDAADLAE